MKDRYEVEWWTWNKKLPHSPDPTLDATEFSRMFESHEQAVKFSKSITESMDCPDSGRKLVFDQVHISRLEFIPNHGFVITAPSEVIEGKP